MPLYPLEQLSSAAGTAFVSHGTFIASGESAWANPIMVILNKARKNLDPGSPFFC
jgi:hypothetical protein